MDAGESGLERNERETLRLRSAQVAWRRVADDVIVLDELDAAYLVVNASGSVIWEMLAEGATRGELIGALEDRFDLAPGPAGDDVDAFLAQMAAQGLIERPAP